MLGQLIGEAAAQNQPHDHRGRALGTVDNENYNAVDLDCVSLGAAVGPAASGIPSNLPVGSKAEKAAEKVRSLAVTKVADAFTKLFEEAKTQKLVWKSLLHTKAKNRQAEIKEEQASLEAKLDEIQEAYQSGDKNRAVTLADQLQQAHRGKGPSGKGHMLGQATLAAARTLVKEYTLVAWRQELASRLDTAMVPASLPQTAEDKQVLEAELVACTLGDANLERRIRQVLLLPLPAGKEKAAPVNNQFFAPVYVTGSRKLNEIVGKMPATPARHGSTAAVDQVFASGGYGPAVGQEGVASSMSRMSNTLRGDAVTGPIASNMSTITEQMDPGTIAQRLRDFADASTTDSWSTLQKEWEVVQLVWQSVALTKVKKDAKARFLAEVDELRGKFADVLEAKDSDLQRALTALAVLVPRDGKATDTLSRSLVAAMNTVLKQDRLRQPRWELAERLATSHIPATLPHEAAEKKSMEDFITSCELADHPFLAREARSLLLLPLPAELAMLGPPAAATLSSTRSRATPSGKLNSNMRKVSNKPSASVPPAVAAQPVAAQPPEVLGMAPIKESI